MNGKNRQWKKSKVVSGENNDISDDVRIHVAIFDSWSNCVLLIFIILGKSNLSAPAVAPSSGVKQNYEKTLSEIEKKELLVVNAETLASREKHENLINKRNRDKEEKLTKLREKNKRQKQFHHDLQQQQQSSSDSIFPSSSSSISHNTISLLSSIPHPPHPPLPPP